MLNTLVIKMGIQNFFHEKFKKMSLRTRIISSFIIIFLVVSILPIMYISLSNAKENLENEKQIRSFLMNTHCDQVASEFTAQILALQSSFHAISDHSDISDMLEWVMGNSTLQNEFMSYPNQTYGDFYPQRINHTEMYQQLYANFETFYNGNLHINALRLFSKDGNIIIGVKEGQPDMIDFKGNQQWFKNSLELPTPTNCYMSPISLCSKLNVSALRFYKPIMINGTIEGIIHINYDAQFFLNEISTNIHHSTHYNLLIDSNFEDMSTGEFLGEMYVVNNLNNTPCLNVSTAGQIEFKVAMFETLSDKDIGRITLNGEEFYFSWQKVSLNQREWYVAYLLLASEFTKSADSIFRTNIFILFIVLLLVLGIASLLSFYFSEIIARSEEKIEKAELETEKLRSLLPICASCKKIRDKNDDWQPIDAFLTTHEKIDFTHSLCPDCIKELYPGLLDD